MNLNYVGNGKVVLIAGGGKIYTDIATRFVRSEKSLDDIIASEYDRDLVRKIVDSGHKAAVEFDQFIFGVEGYARVSEVQLVRKRLASYMMKTGRANKKGNRSFDIVIPENIDGHSTNFFIPTNKIKLPNGVGLEELTLEKYVSVNIDTNMILDIIEVWYNDGIDKGLPEEDLRYIKPQATEFKAIISMNCHALLDWYQIRCCLNAQNEIRDMANKMLKLCKEAIPDIFYNAGANCKALGYCPENSMQHNMCKGKIITKNDAIKLISEHWNK